MLQPVQEESAVRQVGKSVVERIVCEQFLRPLAFGNVAVHDYQFVSLPFRISDWTRGRFQSAPRPVLVAYPVLHPFPVTAKAGVFGGFQYARAVVRMNLIERRSGLQVLGGVSKNFFIRGTVVEPAAIAIDKRDHVGGVFTDELKK